MSISILLFFLISNVKDTKPLYRAMAAYEFGLRVIVP